MGDRQVKILVPLLDSFAGGCPELPLLFQDLSHDAEFRIASYSEDLVLRERWDVIYIYWPEWSVRREAGLARMGFDSLRFVALLCIAKARGAKVVWHANNLLAHEVDQLGLIDLFFRAFSLVADHLIAGTQTVLDDFIRQYPVLRGAGQWLVPLGHARGLYPDSQLSRAEARDYLQLPTDSRIALSLGMVRPYKNHASLIRAYREVAAKRDDTMLVIAGKAVSQGLENCLRQESAGVESVRFDFRYIPDEQLQYYLRACDFYAIATSLATTSGTAMLALSFDRPVVLPHRAEYLEWPEMLGACWVRTYSGGMRPHVLAEAFDTAWPDGRPPLEQYFDWHQTRRGLREILMRIVRDDSEQNQGRH